MNEKPSQPKRNIEVLIVDFHTKAYPGWLKDKRGKYLSRDTTFKELFINPEARLSSTTELIEAMRKNRVSHSVLMGVGWTDIDLARHMNDYIIDSVHRFGSKLTGFASVDPSWGKNAVVELQRCAKAGLKGLGELHPDTQGFDLGSVEVMGPIMEVVQEHDLIVTTHSSEPIGHSYPGKGETHPGKLWRFIEHYPESTIVCAHWGGGLPFYNLMPEISCGMDNVYFDTAASPFLYDKRIFEIMKSLIGINKVLLGSDFPLMDPSRLLKQIDRSSLSQDDKEAIQGGNATRLLGLNRADDC